MGMTAHEIATTAARMAGRCDGVELPIKDEKAKNDE